LFDEAKGVWFKLQAKKNTKLRHEGRKMPLSEKKSGKRFIKSAKMRIFAKTKNLSV